MSIDHILGYIIQPEMSEPDRAQYLLSSNGPITILVMTLCTEKSVYPKFEMNYMTLNSSFASLTVEAKTSYLIS